MNRAAWFLADLLFPNRCGCCGEIIAYDAYFCDACAEALEGLRTSADAWEALHAGEEFPWERAFSVYAYRGAARSGVLAMKDGSRNFGISTGELLADEVRQTLMPEQIGCVTWVPIGRRRRRAQGYAHAELLGKSLAKALARPARGDLLTERDSALRQHQLNAEERKLFAERFQHTRRSLKGQTVLLCDDVLTTGNTLKRCASLLREAGAAHVYAAVAAVRLRSAEKEQSAG